MPISASLAQPQPNTGSHAQAALYASQALDAMKKAVAMVDPSSPLGQAILDSLKRISKEVGNVPADAQVNSLQSQLQSAQQGQMQKLVIQALAKTVAAQHGAAGGGAPGGMPGGGMAPGAGAAGPATPAPMGAAA